jgi:hypothetical protein
MTASKERLILFTRYPEPGKVKTRLVNALGQQGAAELHKRMTEHIAKTVRQFAATRSIATVYFEGALFGEMSRWLGKDFLFQPQSAGDIGERMANAFANSFLDGAERVVIIGSDCPEISLNTLEQAFQALRHNHVVIGPAKDGGYYLIGLSMMIPQLFRNIQWGTERVFQQTMKIVLALELNAALLQPLTDIDRPEDLQVWYECVQKPQATPRNHLEAHSGRIAVVIPTLNEESNIAATLKSVQLGENIQVVVVDAGSVDNTVRIALDMGAQVFIAKKGRAYQMNHGATAAWSDIVLFLHGDTTLPQGFDKSVRTLLAQSGVTAGAFQLRIASHNSGVRLIETLVRFRSTFFQTPYGDQGLFLKTSLFKELGGFPQMPIMEDFVFVQNLKKKGRIAIASDSVETSASRWERLGVVKTTLLNQLMIVGYLLGVPLALLAKWYGRRRY